MAETPEVPEALPLADVAAVTADATASAHECEMPETKPVPETAKERDPMLDVHPAHHAANSWKEFFIHIATIVLGLIIAVGLEQTVEYIHHSRELSQARKELTEEKTVNIESFRRSAASFQKSSLYLKEYLATLRLSIKDSAAPLRALNVPVDFVYSQYTAWATAQREGALTLMPSGEQSANDRMYVGLHTLDQMEDRAYLSVQHAESVFLSGLDPHDLSLEQKKQLYRDASEALTDVRYALTIQRVSIRFNPEFGDPRSLDSAPDPGTLDPAAKALGRTAP